jgi:prepilin-type N-terminal cleavage/methylation domain-containing protein
MVKRERGYTMAETMIAAAILSILGSVLFLGQDRERDALGASFARLRAETTAANELEMLRADPHLLLAGSGDFAALPAGLRGTRTVREIAPGLFEVVIEVLADGLDRPHVLTTRIAKEATP